MQTLHPDSFLQGGRYKIVRSLGQGGFGITYLAIQCGLERKVAIKEFFMREFCERDGSTSRVTLGTEGSRETVNRFRDKFLKEARHIAQLNHPNIVRIIDVFEEHGTAYYVMEYASNGSLADKVKSEGYLSELVATRYILQVADALCYIHHQTMNHLDVKPANIMLNEKEETMLIDFGLSKQYDAATGGLTSSTPVGISEGYAPMEQYKLGGVGAFSPPTDIYALGATFFKLLTGHTPPSASDVYEDGVPVALLQAKGVSQKAINVICKSMEPRKRDRMNNVQDFIVGLQVESPASGHDDIEVTLLTSDNPRIEPERKRQESISQTYTANGVSFQMIMVEGGTFIMGATSEQGSDAYGIEKPAHPVTLNSYSIGQTEVTQALWEAVMGRKPSPFMGGWKTRCGKGPDYPAYNVSWDDCQTFLSKLNDVTGKRFRLPTEAEWEFAARGGTRSKGYKYSGSNTLGNVAWYDNNSGGSTHPVAQKQSNELGLYDMSGNVWEWCQDWYGSYSGSPQTNPKGPNDGSLRVFRGGSWFCGARGCRSSFRGNCTPINRDFDLGLRLCLSE